MFHIPSLTLTSPVRQLVEIEPSLFVGTEKEGNDTDLLEEYGITHIINCSRTDNVNENTYNYLQLQFSDDMSGSVLAYMPLFYLFIESAIHPENIGDERDINKSGKVLVHCRKGISRSPAVIIAYLMKKYSYSFNKAFDHVASKYPSVKLNDFLQQELCEYERCQYNSFLAHQMILYRKILFAEKLFLQNIYIEFHAPSGYFARSYSPKKQYIQTSKLFSKSYRCKQCGTVLFYGVNIIYHIPSLSSYLLKEYELRTSDPIHIHSEFSNDLYLSNSQISFSNYSIRNSACTSTSEQDDFNEFDNDQNLCSSYHSHSSISQYSLSLTTKENSINNQNRKSDSSDHGSKRASLVRSIRSTGVFDELIIDDTPIIFDDVKNEFDALGSSSDSSLPSSLFNYKTSKVPTDVISNNINMESEHLPLSDSLFLIKYGQYDQKPNLNDLDVQKCLDEFCFTPSESCNIYIEIPKWVQKQLQELNSSPLNKSDLMEAQDIVYCKNKNCKNKIGVIMETDLCSCGFRANNILKVNKDNVY